MQKLLYHKLPPFLQMFFTLLASVTALFFLLHIIFYFIFEPKELPLSTGDLATALWLGFRFDLRVAIALLLPLFFVGWIPWISPLRSKLFLYLWTIIITLGFSVLALIYAVDFGHYSYLALRIDFSAMRFLEDAAISAQMLWESYPVVWILIGYAMSIRLFYFLLVRHFEHYATIKAYPLSKAKLILISFISFLAVVVGAYSKLSQYPLRWSDAAFSKHPFAAQLAYNPAHYLFDTWKNGRISYNLEDTKKYYPIISDFLHVDKPNVATLNYQRDRKVAPLASKRNVVLILVESYAMYKTSMSGNPLDPTPFSNKMAKEGLYFPNYFTPSTGTARSVFTMITGIPDVEAKGTSSRNPLIVDQHTIMNEFEGYEKFYFLGGSASWGNIRGILSKNVDNLHLYEEGSYSSPRNDVWGISDIDLFREANTVFKEQKKPFFAIVQTSGNHRPYTIPEHSYGFELKHPGDEAVKPYGFESEEEFNAYRLMDHSIKHFIEIAKEAGYAENTIFAFWGDHGLNGYAGKHSPKGESTSELILGSHRVPFVIWSPKLIKAPKVIEKTASEVDVMPTIAALAGQSYTTMSMGRDLFDSNYDESDYAFTIMHGQNPRIGVVSDKFYFFMNLGLDEGSLHEVYSGTPSVDVSAEHPELTERLKALTLGYYKTAQYMPYHNKRSDIEKSNKDKR
jgi:phosphoglycerol transferase MdoB-like AlkP superfamily enzyme